MGSPGGRPASAAGPGRAGKRERRGLTLSTHGPWPVSPGGPCGRWARPPAPLSRAWSPDQSPRLPSPWATVPGGRGTGKATGPERGLLQPASPAPWNCARFSWREGWVPPRAPLPRAVRRRADVRGLLWAAEKTSRVLPAVRCFGSTSSPGRFPAWAGSAGLRSPRTRRGGWGRGGGRGRGGRAARLRGDSQTLASSPHTGACWQSDVTPASLSPERAARPPGRACARAPHSRRSRLLGVLRAEVACPELRGSQDGCRVHTEGPPRPAGDACGRAGGRRCGAPGE